MIIILFVLCWIMFGVFCQALFMYVMKKKYPKEDYDWDLLPFQIVISILAGPISLVALVIFCELEDEDEEL